MGNFFMVATVALLTGCTVYHAGPTTGVRPVYAPRVVVPLAPASPREVQRFVNDSLQDPFPHLRGGCQTLAEFTVGAGPQYAEYGAQGSVTCVRTDPGFGGYPMRGRQYNNPYRPFRRGW
jgi:hypothetical protein